MKKTAVEWLTQQLMTNTLPKSKDELINGDWKYIIEQTKEMEKQQIIDAYGKIKMFAEQYYNETYGSKGSDDQVPDVRKMVDIIKWIDEEILLNPYYSDSPRLKEGANMVKVKLQQYTPTSSQTEISDEEIDAAFEYFSINTLGESHSWESIWKEAIKWYIEQLKKKQ